MLGMVDKSSSMNFHQYISRSPFVILDLFLMRKEYN